MMPVANEGSLRSLPNMYCNIPGGAYYREAEYICMHICGACQHTQPDNHDKSVDNSNDTNNNVIMTAMKYCLYTIKYNMFTCICMSLIVIVHQKWRVIPISIGKEWVSPPPQKKKMRLD